MDNDSCVAQSPLGWTRANSKSQRQENIETSRSFFTISTTRPAT